MEVISQDITERAGTCSKLLVATVEQIWMLPLHLYNQRFGMTHIYIQKKQLAMAVGISVELPSNGAYTLSS